MLLNLVGFINQVVKVRSGGRKKKSKGVKLKKNILKILKFQLFYTRKKLKKKHFFAGAGASARPFCLHYCCNKLVRISFSS